jgi:diguanylate cyclase (GGDEF)-like protein/PAS domain S-box-containing protein
MLAGALALLALGGALYLHNERQRRLRSQHDLEELRRIEKTLSESEAQYRLLAENSSDVVWLYDLAAHRFRYASPSVERLLGYHPAAIQRMSMADVLPPEQAQELLQTLPQRVTAFVQHGDETARTVSAETLNIHRDGHHVPVEVVSTLLVDAQGEVTQVLGVTRDISARKKTEAQLTQLSQAVEQSPASVIITDLDANIVYVNPAFEQISGYPRAEVQGQNPRLLRSGKTPPEVYASMWFTLSAGLSWNGEMTNRHQSGREYVQSMNVAPVRDTQGRVSHYLAVQLDVTAQKHAEEKAYQLAWYNALTGLPNRHKLLADLQEVLRTHQRTDELCSLLLLNVDRFQHVNEALGHSAGDLLLKQVAERLTDLLQPGDLLAHLSADEFAILLYTGTPDSETASAQALRQAQAVHERLDTRFVLAEHEPLNISVSIGITLLPHADSESPADILRRADTAMHRAKQAGTRQTALFDASMEQLITRRFALEQDLRRGLVANELRLYLQPQVNAQGTVVSAEALVRWQHPELGLLTPGTFISIAEESELIAELGRWVLKAVCRHLGDLRRDGLHLPISVNVSPRQFHQPGFVHVVQDILLANGASAEDLVIEITEGIVMDQIDSVVQKMAYLTSLGIQFSLDDFGTGYSSLAYLKRLPIHEIKIDRSFVQDAPNDPSDGALVEAILSVARHLRLKVVAEGVETVEQAEFLNARGTVIHQGYLFGRPEPAADMLAHWRAGQLKR